MERYNALNHMNWHTPSIHAMSGLATRAIRAIALVDWDSDISQLGQSEAECFVLLKPTAAGQGWLGRQPKPLRACQCKSNAPYAILDGFLAHVR